MAWTFACCGHLSSLPGHLSPLPVAMTLMSPSPPSRQSRLNGGGVCHPRQRRLHSAGAQQQTSARQEHLPAQERDQVRGYHIPDRPVFSLCIEQLVSL